VKQIRKRVTYANVMSSIAVFLVLGGGAAYAAKKIGSNEIKGNSITTGKIKKEAVSASKIKKNAITTAKIANGAVTGAKLNLGTVGTVPNANHANSADNANNANTVGGQSVVKIFAKLSPGQTNVQIASLGGFTITASCNGGDAVENLILHAPNNVASFVQTQGNGEEEGVTFSRDNGIGNISAQINRSGLNENRRGTATFNGATTTGTVVSGDITYEDSNTFSSENVCGFAGHAIVG
jgi:hypothetical protein